MESYSGVELQELTKTAKAEGAFEGFSKPAIQMALNNGITTHSEVQPSEFRFITRAPFMVGYEGGKPKVFIKRDGKRYNIQLQDGDRLQWVTKSGGYGEPTSARSAADSLQEVGVDVASLDWKWFEKGKRRPQKSLRQREKEKEPQPVGSVQFDKFREMLLKQFTETQKEEMKTYINEIVDAAMSEFEKVLSGDVDLERGWGSFQSKAARQLEDVGKQVDSAMKEVGQLISNVLGEREWERKRIEEGKEPAGYRMEPESISQNRAREIINKMNEVARRRPPWWTHGERVVT